MPDTLPTKSTVGGLLLGDAIGLLTGGTGRPLAALCRKRRGKRKIWPANGQASFAFISRVCNPIKGLCWLATAVACVPHTNG